MTATRTGLPERLLDAIEAAERYWKSNDDARDCQECAALSDHEPGPTVDTMLARCKADREIIAAHMSGEARCGYCGEADYDECPTLVGLGQGWGV